MANWSDADLEDLLEFGSSFNIAPQTFKPVVWFSPETGEREMVLMQWDSCPSGRWMREAYPCSRRERCHPASFRESIKKRRIEECLFRAEILNIKIMGRGLALYDERNVLAVRSGGYSFLNVRLDCEVG